MEHVKITNADFTEYFDEYVQAQYLIAISNTDFIVVEGKRFRRDDDLIKLIFQKLESTLESKIRDNKFEMDYALTR